MQGRLCGVNDVSSTSGNADVVLTLASASPLFRTSRSLHAPQYPHLCCRAYNDSLAKTLRWSGMLQPLRTAQRSTQSWTVCPKCGLQANQNSPLFRSPLNGQYMPTTTNNPRIITKEAEYRDYYNIVAIVSSQIYLVGVALYRLNCPYNIDLIQPCFGPWGVIALRKSEISRLRSSTGYALSTPSCIKRVPSVYGKGRLI